MQMLLRAAIITSTDYNIFYIQWKILKHKRRTFPDSIASFMFDLSSWYCQRYILKEQSHQRNQTYISLSNNDCKPDCESAIKSCNKIIKIYATFLPAFSSLLQLQTNPWVVNQMYLKPRLDK